jgi:hypothetical protein
VRWTPSRPQALDVVLALAVAVLTATGTWFAGQNQPDTRPLDLLGWADELLSQPAPSC